MNAIILCSVEPPLSVFGSRQRGEREPPEIAPGADPHLSRRTAAEHGKRDKPGAAFLRKDEIARRALESPLTLRESETI